jgi:quercetin dioxygenase-like cupin family protein
LAIKTIRLSEIESRRVLGGEIKPIFTPETAETKNFRFSVGQFKQDEGLRTHIHPGSEEVYYVIQGRGIVYEGEDKKEIIVEHGMSAYIPPGTIHGVVNKEDELLLVAFFVAPGKDKTEVI